MRRAHYLKPNATSETVQQAIWFDTETDLHKVAHDKMEHWLRFGWACYRRRLNDAKWSEPEWFRFNTIKMFWDWALNHTRDKTKLYMFCHNTSFDLPVLNTFKMMVDAEYKLKVAIIDSPPTILRYRNRKRSVSIVDTLNIWRMPLADLGKHVGLAKLDMPQENAPQEAWDTYGKRDVEVIMQACLLWWDWLHKNDMGGFSCTLASQAMRVYRHKYMTHPIMIDDHVDAIEVSRQAFHGGRCECFRIGTFVGEFTLLDVNSMYPFVMATCAMPTKLQSVSRRVTIGDLTSLIKRFAVVAHVQVETREPFAAVYSNGKLIFPVGQFECHLTTPDILYALERGYIKTVRMAAFYESAVCFSKFVNELYGHRLQAEQDGDTIQAWQFKILMNSFYGKFGQRGNIWTTCGTADVNVIDREIVIDYDTKQFTVYRTFGGIVQRLSKEGESQDSHPAIAAHVTAYARNYLFQLIQRAKIENCLYADTDSLLVTREGLERLIDCVGHNELGKLKIEGQYTRVKLYGCKDYAFDNKIKTKGIRKNAVQVDVNTFSQERWSSLRGLIREGNLNAPITTRVYKRLIRVYDKGTVGPDGFVSAFQLPLDSGARSTA